MKLKILITPLMIVAIIYLIVWVAIPTYFGPDGVVFAKEKLQKDQDALVSIKRKEENANKLILSLDQNEAQRKIVEQYLPKKKADEDVIANVNSLAIKSGIFLTSIELEKESNKLNPAPILDENGNEITDDAVGLKNSINKFKIRISASGEYEKIHQFVVDMSKWKRFNSMTALKISPVSNTEEVETNLLQADIDIELNYLNKIELAGAIKSDIFLDGEFDMDTIEKIKEKTSMDVLKVEAGVVGQRSNPFKQ